MLGVSLALGGCGELSEPPGSTAGRPGPTTVETPRGAGRAAAPRRRDRFPGPSSARDGRLVSVVDGDTIELTSVGRVRLIGVDTPEVFGGAECYGAEASEYTKEVLRPGRRVSYRLGREPRDRYGRALAYVWLADGRLFNGLLAERGYAVPLAIAPNVDMAPRFRAAARGARSARRGLWSPRACGRDADRPAAGSAQAARPPRRGTDHDCADFDSRAEAQRYFESHGGRTGRDVEGLDGDGDGRVCESL